MGQIHTRVTDAFLQWLMRFSAAFTRHPVAVRRPDAPVVRPRTAAPVPAVPRMKQEPLPARELPLDLDQRVRLVGEW